MRGVPNNPVQCLRCGRMNGCAGDSLCHSCRMLGRSSRTRKFAWTPELDEVLRRAYKSAHTRADLSTNLNHLQRRTGFTRNVILTRAVQLGLSFSTRRAWTAEELRTLEDLAGRTTIKSLSSKLNRTHASVQGRVRAMGLSVRFSEGYSLDDLRQLLGVSVRSVQAWLAAGWLRTVRGRVPESVVVRFLRQHSEQYHLGRVDQAWFKGLLFPAFNSAPRRSAVRPVGNLGSAGPQRPEKQDFRIQARSAETPAYPE